MTPTRVVVVEDNPAVRDLWCDILSLSGYDVVPARDGLEALARFDAATYDLFGYVTLSHGRLLVVHQRLSLPRMGTLVLAVFLASLLAGLAVRVGLLLMEQSEERPVEVDSS